MRRIRPRMPGRTHSIFGLLIGLVLIGFGIFAVIPVYGPVGVLWTFLAVFVVVVNGRNVFRIRGNAPEGRADRREAITAQDQQDSQDPQDPQDPQETEERLIELYHLFQRGRISEAEYLKRRNNILRRNAGSKKDGEPGS